MHANSREEIDKDIIGDIGALVGLKGTTTGDTLVAEKAPKIILEKMVSKNQLFHKHLNQNQRMQWKNWH